MSDEKGKDDSKLNGWAALIAAILTGAAALITSIGFPEFFPGIVNNFFSKDANLDNNQVLNENDLGHAVNFFVYSEEYSPLENVEIRFILEGAPIIKRTDSNGYAGFSIRESRNAEVIFRKEGFHTNRQTINLEADTSTKLDIVLRRNKLPEFNGDMILSVAGEESGFLGLKQAMPYSEAREILINNGWQAKVPITLSDYPDLIIPSTEYIFSDKGYSEVVHCYGTGLGLCYFEFSDERGTTLVVVTANNQPGQEPSVFSWNILEAEP